ncbi:MAG: hypothetical protein IJB60_00405, partial [Bacteroidaceae bacterium]|nr:hypothetical protein [Bacteroidaceae bacterium]
WGATSFSRQWLAARLLTLLIWGRRNSPTAQTSCALIQNVAKPRSIPYGDGLFLKMFGGWKAKQYSCPSLWVDGSAMRFVWILYSNIAVPL